jgi:C-terminal processing protease CtpA/Prc
VPFVKLGNLTVVRPTVNISDAVGAAVPSALADGTVGMPVIRRTAMILDYTRSRIIFEKNSEFDAPYQFANVSGLQLERVGNTIRVRNVISGSPAADAGLRIGDEILKVDDTPVPPSGSVNLPGLREPNTSHRLTIRRGGETLVVTIALRRLI